MYGIKSLFEVLKYFYWHKNKWKTDPNFDLGIFDPWVHISDESVLHFKEQYPKSKTS